MYASTFHTHHMSFLSSFEISTFSYTNTQNDPKCCLEKLAMCHMRALILNCGALNEKLSLGINTIMCEKRHSVIETVKSETAGYNW